jgi:hypothetical protein
MPAATKVEEAERETDAAKTEAAKTDAAKAQVSDDDKKDGKS